VTSELKIARGFTLPLDVVTEATAIVATRGAGKSSTSAVVVEEGFAAGVQTVVFDRTGVYWGLRSNSDGTGPGLPIYVLGGPHGDVPLEAHSGVLIADLVVDSGHSFVLDLSDLSKSGAIKFAADFLERLYDRKARSRTTLLLIMDEAHFYAPQTPRGGFKGDAARLMGAMEDVVGLGRSRGIGVVLTTQRTQALNKAILDLIETLFVMRMLSPRARDAVQDWIREKHEDDREGVIETLESLPTGTAWVWSPLRGILRKIAVRRIKTFDSYATPKPGETAVEPTVRRELDLTSLGEQMAATAERAKENDPTELRRRARDAARDLDAARGQIEDLERELRDRPPETVIVEKPIAIEAELDAAWKVITEARAIAENLSKSLEAVAQPLAAAIMAAVDAAEAKPATPPAPAREHVRRPQRSEPAPAASSNGHVDIGKGARTVLGVLAEFPEGRTMNELAFLAGYSAKASTMRGILAELRKAGYVEQGSNPIRATAEGLAAAGGVRERPSGPALLDHWLEHPRMGEGERKVLLALIDAGGELTHEELCARTGYSPDASTMRGILGDLRKLGLVEKGARRVAPEFLAAIA
jgi:hypothetical protein